MITEMLHGRFMLLFCAFAELAIAEFADVALRVEVVDHDLTRIGPEDFI